MEFGTESLQGTAECDSVILPLEGINMAEGHLPYSIGELRFLW